MEFVQTDRSYSYIVFALKQRKDKNDPILTKIISKMEFVLTEWSHSYIVLALVQNEIVLFRKPKMIILSKRIILYYICDLEQPFTRPEV